MVDTNQKASDVGISLLQEQRAETKKREDDIKKYQRRRDVFDLGVGLYQNTVLDAKAENFALSNSPFKAKLVAMQGNAANILTIQNTIDGGGQGGYGGNSYNYWYDHFATQLTNQWSNQTGKTPPRASVAKEAKKLTEERLKDWDNLVSSARAVPSSVKELEKDWENFESLNVPATIGEQMGRGLRNVFRSDEERKRAETLTKADINANPLFAKYKNFADRYEVYSQFNPGMADAIHTLATDEKWKDILDPNTTPVTSTTSVNVRLNDGSMGSQTINTIVARTIEGKWVHTEITGATSLAEAATGAELEKLYNALNPDGELALNAGMRKDPLIPIQQLYALYHRPPYTKVDLTDEKVALENETTARKLYEMEMFELDPNKYFKQNFTVSGLEYSRTDIPLPEGVPDFKTWFANKKLEWNNYKPRGVSWEKESQGSKTGTATTSPNDINDLGTLIVTADLDETTQEVFNTSAIQDQIADKTGVVPIMFGPNKFVPRSSVTGNADDDTMVQVVYNTDSEEFFMLPIDKQVSDIYTTDVKEQWKDDSNLKVGDSVELADGSTLSWTGSQFEQSGSGLTAKRITFADIPEGKINDGIKNYALSLYTSFLNPQREIEMLEERLETGIYNPDVTKPALKNMEGKEIYTGSKGRARRKKDEERVAYLKANPKEFKYRSVEELFNSIMTGGRQDFTDVVDLATFGDWKRVRQLLIDAVNSELPDESSRIAYLEKQGLIQV